MVFLLLTILSSIAIASILRLNEDRGGDRFVVAGSNYVVAVILSVLFASPVSGTIAMGELAFALVVGCGFVAGFVVLMMSMQESGMAVPTTASRLSTLVPVVGSVFLYGESPSTLQVVGIAASVAAFAVLGLAQRTRSHGGALSSRALVLLAAVFAVFGSIDLAMKIAQESGAARGPFLIVVFATACTVCLGVVVFGRRRVRARDVVLGAMLGVPNFMASYFVLRALGELEGVVVFPVMNASVVIGATAVAIVFWRERPTAVTAIGLALAAIAVVLLGIG